jgi:hypothetical protein|tara:strand:- start:210 stop:764 length:555 start_codon:yes stop_codon:yes gene_type:complete
VSVLRKAATDPAFLALMAGAGGAGVATQGAGLLDLFRGETHGGNSGEIPLNYLISALAGLPPMAVALASMGIDPVLNEATTAGMNNLNVSTLADKDVAAGRLSREDADRIIKAQINMPTPEMDRVVKEQMNQAVEKGSQAMTREQILKNRLRRGGLATLGAAGIGSVPAILAMKDQPAQALPVA